jgi:guanosine-3',5'-bis(diphosphate) 3'-pyrophosphohydrolase
LSATIDQLIADAKKTIPDLNVDRLRKAYAFAAAAHDGQMRNSGEPYITHPLAAATILTTLKVDEDTLVACLLHDVPEDTSRTLDDIQTAFGEQVAKLVDGMTKISKVQYKNNMEQHQVENLRKMALVMAKDLRVVLIRLADRMHNMMTLSAIRPEKRVRIAKETLEIYAPLADRLGIWQFKWQLEDLCFRHLNPIEESMLRKQLSEGLGERKEYIERVRKALTKELKEVGINEVEIFGRTKHMYSIYQKMKRKYKTLDEIHDIFALRVIVDKVPDCYAVLGVIHDLWKPKPGRFKDYIAVPKANGYQSLHTTVFCIGGRLTEFQIRTQDQHREAEYGIAAHWVYNATKKGDNAKKFFSRDSWLKSIIELQETADSSQEFVEGLKIDVFQDRIFVFTPEGDVKDLPSGATALDFAYSVHTAIGHRTIGVKINSSIAPLATRLETGDVVEVLTSRIPAGPKRGWLSIVKTSQARTKIKSWFKTQDKEKNVEVGKALMERTLKQAGKNKIDQIAKDRIDPALKDLGFKNLDELLAGIGEGMVTPFNVLKKLFKPYELLQEVSQAKKKISDKSRIFIQGADDFEVHKAKCCNPVVGEKIVGFVTLSKSISVHRVNCSSLRKLDPERLIHASWEAPEDDKKYIAKIKILAEDRKDLTRDIMLSVSKVDVIVLRLEILKRARGEISLLLVCEMSKLDVVAHLFSELESIKGIHSAVHQR